MSSAQESEYQWKRVSDVASLLLDSPTPDWDSILARECTGEDSLRAQVLEVCRSYSEDDEFFGAPVVSPLIIEDSLVGQRIGPWEILRLLGEGGMGRVYLVERADGVFSQYAALKLNREFAGPEAVRRFHDERRIVAMLEHPSIARAIDGGETQAGTPYLVMEYVEGGCPIDEFQPASPVRDKIRMFLQVVEAVAAAHLHQVAHRDLKPSNILVTPGGLPKVLDFGIAKLLGDQAQSSDQTHQGAHAALTPTYASPEQLLREPSSLSSDIYSLGAVLYKILTGKPPHDLTGLNILESARLVAESDVAKPSMHAKGLDADVDAIVIKTLERNPARRYASATDLAADLRRYLEGFPVKARDGALWCSISRFVRRHPGGSLAAAVCVAVLAIIGVKTIHDGRAQIQRLDQLRQTAVSVIADHQSQLSKLTGSTNLRSKIAANEKQYLNSIYADAVKDPALKRQVASAYGSLASYESEQLDAQESLSRSWSLWREIATGPISDSERLQMATIARRLGWSQTNTGKLKDSESSLNESLRLLDSLSGTSTEEAARPERVMLLFELSRLGAWTGRGPMAIDNARKALAEHEKLPYRPLDRRGIALTRMQLADVTDTFGFGDAKLGAEALTQAKEAVRSVREASCEEWSCRGVKVAVLTRAPIIYAHQGLIQEALGLRDGVDLAEAMLEEDPENTSANASLKFGLSTLGWLLQESGKLDESLRARRRLLEISVVLEGGRASAEEKLDEAIACSAVGRTLVGLKRLREAQGYFERGAEILAHPPTETVAWFMRQADGFKDLGLLHEKMGRHEAARAEFARCSAAAGKFLAKTGSALAKEIEAEAHYLQGKALLAADKPAGCGLLRKSLDRLAELKKASGLPNKFWDDTEQVASKAIEGCKVQ